MTDCLINTIRKSKIPKVILRFIMMNFLDLKTIKNLLLTVKEMNVLDDYSKDLLAKAKKGFTWNCKNGHLTVAKWLYSRGGVNIHANEENAFRLSCEYGHLTVAKWLYSLTGVNIHAVNEDAFAFACEKGHLAIAQWLYSLDEGMDRTDPYSLARTGQGGVNIHVDDEYAFRHCCENGHLALAEWLYSLDRVNIHVHNEYAFRYCCENGHLTIAKWLYSLGVNIHVNNGCVFRCAKINVLNWLNSLSLNN